VKFEISILTARVHKKSRRYTHAPIARLTGLHMTQLAYPNTISEVYSRMICVAHEFARETDRVFWIEFLILSCFFVGMDFSFLAF
jgi:hypothetical protein